MRLNGFFFCVVKIPNLIGVNTRRIRNKEEKGNIVEIHDLNE